MLSASARLGGERCVADGTRPPRPVVIIPAEKRFIEPFCCGWEGGSAGSSRGDGCGTTCAACWGRWAAKTADS
jgi:outer membrane lipoprotein SlyB